ncbi:hypothetical protein T4A_10500 [Trichinella pseudospiralis]|uniref:Uncharacterized protein n=1 Tax=Trichinella pseudospiralis TaxID=6337 RepID=A0A0V1EYD8_TRIPS|nr:hypothetical protein T4A_10500 [Trichinella pseudospiralis]
MDITYTYTYTHIQLKDRKNEYHYQCISILYATWAKSSVHRQKADNCFKQEAESTATLNQSSVKVDASWPQQRRLFFIFSHLMLMFLCECSNDDRCHRTSSVVSETSHSELNNLRII